MQARVQLLILVATAVGCASGAKSDRNEGCKGEAAPGTITEMIGHINTLPLPVDLPCLLDSLARPLQLELTDNPISAQPADGPDSPRVFVFIDALTMSLVPSGPGASVVEFGEDVGDTLSLKGEIEIPVTETLELDAPYTRIEHDVYGTVCAVCHIKQEPYPGGGMASVAIRPTERSLVPVADLRAVAQECAPDTRHGRCGVLTAMFDGAVEHHPFSIELPTILDLSE